VTALTIEYHVIPEAQFVDLFRAHAEGTKGHPRANPYTANRDLPDLTHENGVFRADLGVVQPEHCAGHFEGYPAQPVSLLTRDAVQLVGAAVGCLHEAPAARVTVCGGEVTTNAFAFAGERLALEGTRIVEDMDLQQEVWRVVVRSTLHPVVASFELTVQLHLGSVRAPVAAAQ
jgi:3-hydroxymyristoyl/3-hydroxydecanoyl-(acyl carrier protein) dehydratase